MSDSPELSSIHTERQNLGRWTVVGMFMFGLVMVGTLWLYWELYTKPFRELQYAIAEQFPDSSPRVIGGKHKSHKDVNPYTLRVVVRVPMEEFDPTQDTPKSLERALILAKLANKFQKLDQYEQMEIHLIQRVPEKKTRVWSVVKPIEEWREVFAGKPLEASDSAVSESDIPA